LKPALSKTFPDSKSLVFKPTKLAVSIAAADAESKSRLPPTPFSVTIQPSFLPN